MTSLGFLLIFTVIINFRSALAQEHPSSHQMSAETPKQKDVHKMSRHPMSPADCLEMEVWDYESGMCMPLPMPNMPMSMFMVHGNGFLVQNWAEGPRGKSALTSPNMLMADIGTSIAEKHYLNLGIMLTSERWTFPEEGYPELLQIGEHDARGKPYVDAQHPHNSPIMGLTLSDTISFGKDKDHVKVFFAPRGQATDGPIAFMHRPTGMTNPDAPLGHHIGQDVGHITSTVLGASVRLGRAIMEVSGFNGTEPEPAKVYLHMGPINSFSVRLIQEFSDQLSVMGSYAYVKSPEPDEPEVEFYKRYSLSAYSKCDLKNNWMFHNTLILGQISNYEHTDNLYSINEEFLFHQMFSRIWGRFEFVQRTPAELLIASASEQNRPRWVTALTAGYTHMVANVSNVEIGLGASVTKDLLPEEYKSAYGGDPWSGRVFLQAGGMGTWDLRK